MSAARYITTTEPTRDQGIIIHEYSWQERLAALCIRHKSQPVAKEISNLRRLAALALGDKGEQMEYILTEYGTRLREQLRDHLDQPTEGLRYATLEAQKNIAARVELILREIPDEADPETWKDVIEAYDAHTSYKYYKAFAFILKKYVVHRMEIESKNKFNMSIQEAIASGKRKQLEEVMRDLANDIYHETGDFDNREVIAAVERFLDFLPSNMNDASWSWLSLQINSVFGTASYRRAARA